MIINEQQLLMLIEIADSMYHLALGGAYQGLNESVIGNLLVDIRNQQSTELRDVK